MDLFRQEELRLNFTPTDNVVTSLSHTDFTDSTAKVQAQRGMRADSQAGIIAENLLVTGNDMSIREAMYLLDAKDNSSNDTGRRLREAKKWLERQDLTIVTCDRETVNGAKYQTWRCTGAYEKREAALAKLKAK